MSSRDLDRDTGRVGRAALALLLGASVTAACEAESSGQGSPGPATSVAVLTEVFETGRDTLANVDSPAVWHGPGGEHWLLVTGKEAHQILIADARTGATLQRVGAEGSGSGQLQRPNGIAVEDDLMWVVERDNGRVQVFDLPTFTPLGSFGQDELILPYGIALVGHGFGAYTAYITDNYELEDDVIPPDSLLGARVRAYRVSVTDGQLSASLQNTFGETSGPGVLRVVESIAADPEMNRLLIADEQEGASMIKVYDLDGRFTGATIGSAFFPNEAEGIALYACADGEGYWVATDQDPVANTFHAFGRRTLEHVGSFRGRVTRNTDGIWLTQKAFGPFTTGAFYAVHDDGSTSAFQWSEVAAALDLRSDCVLP